MAVRNDMLVTAGFAIPCNMLEIFLIERRPNHHLCQSRDALNTLRFRIGVGFGIPLVGIFIQGE